MRRRDFRRLSLVVLLSLVPGIARAQQLAIDYIFLIDVSGSMAGVGGSKPVFDDVRKAIKGFVARLDPGTSAFVIPFADTVRATRRFVLNGPGDVAEFASYIDGLQADGARTGVYQAIAAAVTAADALRQDKAQRAIVVQIYTDGRDNASVGWTLPSILSHFNLKRGPLDWLFFTELGLPPDVVKVTEFGKYERMVYSQDSAVKLSHVQPLLARIHFGNLKGASKPAIRRQGYAVRSDALPEGFALRLRASFPELERAGVLAEVESSTSAPERNVEWRLSIANGESLPDGRYEGDIIIESSDATVRVVPDRVRAVLVHEAPHTLTVARPEGMSDALDLGSVADDEVVVEIPIQFSATAAAASDEVTLALVPDADSGAVASIVRVEPSGPIPVSTTRLRVVVKPDGRLPWGDYSGELRFTSSSLSVVGPLVVDGEPGTRVVPWRFRSPISPWVWIGFGVVAVAAAGALAVRQLRPATFPPLTINVLEPTSQAIDGAGLRRLAFGNGQQYLPQAPALEIVAESGGRTPRVVAHAPSGQWRIKRPGIRQEIAVVSNEALYDRDELLAPGYRMRLAAFDLERGDVQE